MHGDIACLERPAQRFVRERPRLGRFDPGWPPPVETGGALRNGSWNAGGTAIPATSMPETWSRSCAIFPRASSRREQVRLGPLDERGRADHRTAKARDRPGDVQAPAVGNHAAAGDDGPVDFNPRRIDAAVGPGHVSRGRCPANFPVSVATTSGTASPPFGLPERRPNGGDGDPQAVLGRDRHYSAPGLSFNGLCGALDAGTAPSNLCKFGHG